MCIINQTGENTAGNNTRRQIFMKKFLSLLLVVLMVMSAAAFAESAEAPAPKLGQIV